LKEQGQIDEMRAALRGDRERMQARIRADGREPLFPAAVRRAAPPPPPPPAHERGVEEPVTEEPVTEEPVTEEPVTEEPVAQEPVAEPAEPADAGPGRQIRKLTLPRGMSLFTRRITFRRMR
jgi:hypothetical protein